MQRVGFRPKQHLRRNHHDSSLLDRRRPCRSRHRRPRRRGPDPVLVILARSASQAMSAGQVARRWMNSAGDLPFLLAALLLFVAQQIAIRALPLDGAGGALRRGLFFPTTLCLALLALHFRRWIGAWAIAAG